jgi:hypothetical protein
MMLVLDNEGLKGLICGKDDPEWNWSLVNRKTTDWAELCLHEFPMDTGKLPNQSEYPTLACVESEKNIGFFKIKKRLN